MLLFWEEEEEGKGVGMLPEGECLQSTLYLQFSPEEPRSPSYLGLLPIAASVPGYPSPYLPLNSQLC